MPQTPRNTPATSGPGRGTPRTRTTARPGERAHRPRIEPLDRDDVGQVLSDQPAPLPRAQRAMTATWRLIVLFIVIAGLLLVTEAMIAKIPQKKEALPPMPGGGGMGGMDGMY